MKTINVNNYNASLYQEGEIHIEIPSKILERYKEEGLSVYLTVGELKKLLKLAEDD
ncbi:hypothetical protein VPH184E373B_0143 [Vibrio phage 184E37-3b]|nr:hypothetical protein MYOV056v2_p0123 [Vibrio phage 184E37.3a]QZI89931.1 hypothetical protein MYOV057v1_p0016 [Vibrio phage 184E37.1]